MLEPIHFFALFRYKTVYRGAGIKYIKNVSDGRTLEKLLYFFYHFFTTDKTMRGECLLSLRN